MFNYVIKSNNPARDRDSTVVVTITVDPATVKPRLIMSAWLESRKQSIGRMVDSPENRAALQEYTEALVARRLADAILDRACRARVIVDGTSRNRYVTKCHSSGVAIPEGAGFAGTDHTTGKRVYYTFRALIAQFAEPTA